MPVFFATVLLAQTLLGGLPIDGISCAGMEYAAEHIHSHLELFDRGRSVTIPAGVGIENNARCLYWVHTHTADGYIHIEAPVKQPYTLGQFFDIWGQPLSWTQAASLSASHGGRLSIWVNGAAWHGRDPRAIVLRDHETIVVQNGPPFAKATPSDWSKL
jgi:hypothetical protein